MEYGIAILKTVLIFLVVIQLVPVLIWLERKGAAYIQDRRGPNRAAIAGVRLGGLINSLSDVVKLLFKEDITPPHVNKTLFLIAPMITMFVATVTMAVVPFAAPMVLGGKTFLLQVADLDAGLLYVFAMSSLGVYGVMLAGWASNNKFSLLGGLRASAQMISYEVSMGLAVVGIFLLCGSLKLTDIVNYQAAHTWNILLQPIAFFLFVAALFAETNRVPFDLPEGEAEIVAGFHVEYSSMKFALFFMGEYAHIIVGSAILTTLFFGGWNIPGVSAEWMRGHATEIVRWGWLMSSVLMIALGIWLCQWYKRGKFGDLRDYEPLVFGAPLFLAGAAGLAFWFPYHAAFGFGDLGSQITVTLIQFGVFLTKILFLCFFFIWVRWTLPRFRYDQLMRLGWKVMLPLALVNVVVTALVVLVQ